MIIYLKVVAGLLSILHTELPDIGSDERCLLQNYTKAMRLFVGEPVWKAHNRPADHFEIRQKYLASLLWPRDAAADHEWTSHENRKERAGAVFWYLWILDSSELHFQIKITLSYVEIISRKKSLDTKLYFTLL